MFPEITANESFLSQTDRSPRPWTYRFDWQTKQLRQGLDGRYLRTKTYAEYLEEISKKILHTKRFAYAIYSERMGVDYLSDIGKMRSRISLPVVIRQVEEALEAHSQIKRAEVEEIRFEEAAIFTAVSIEGVNGKTRLEVNVWQR